MGSDSHGLKRKKILTLQKVRTAPEKNYQKRNFPFMEIDPIRIFPFMEIDPIRIFP